MGDAYQKALAEFSEIDKQIAALQKRRQELAQFIELGKRLFVDFDSEPATSHRLTVGTVGAITSGTLKDRVEAAAVQILSGGKSRQTRDLLDTMELGHGIEITAKDKVLALSAILSRSDKFQASRKYGWSLKKENSPSVGADGEFINVS